MTTGAKKRAIFEEAGAAPPPPAAPGRAAAEKAGARAAIRVWLILLAALVALMVVVGGLTRLTDSGLSITEWNVVIGALPPLSAADWTAAFEAYKATDEWRLQNSWMTLADFKPIFWWEWGHRFLGRLVGVVWLLPLLWFALRGRIPRGWGLSLVGVGLLGAMQGAIGWWMVWSGLSVRVDVAPYRLMVHLGIAFAIFAWLVWMIVKLGREDWALLQARRRRAPGLPGLARLALFALFAQILLGALVAGTDGWAGWHDWPLMDGAFLAPEALSMAPYVENHFENPAMTQFQHRWFALVPLLLGLLLLLRARRSGHRRSRTWATAVFHGLWLQAGIGIATLVWAAPGQMIWLAALHQLWGLALVGLAVRALFEAAYPSEQSVRG